MGHCGRRGGEITKREIREKKDANYAHGEKVAEDSEECEDKQSSDANSLSLSLSSQQWWLCWNPRHPY